MNQPATGPNWGAYWCIFRTCIEDRLVYRGDFAFATLVRFLPIVTQIYLWGAIYAGAETSELNGYSYQNMVAYFLLVMVSRAFSSMPGLTTGIARDIRDGSIKKYLTQPVDMLGYLFLHRMAHKVVYYSIATIPYVLIFAVSRRFLPGWPDGWILSGWIASLLLSFVLGFLIEALLGLMGFWFLEVSSLIFVYMLMNYFLSGHMLPLDWLPGWLATVVNALPFKYLAFVPAAVILGRYDHASLGRELLAAVVWTIALFIANRMLFHYGVRRYAGYGG